MSENIVEIYGEYFRRAVEEISTELLDIKLNDLSGKEDRISIHGKKLDVIIGMTGDYKGRLLLESTEESARTITEIMNFGTLERESDLYLYMGEFANILSGRAITFINNSNQKKIIRLTPPAIFSGVDLEITTPNIEFINLCFGKDDLHIRLNIGFGGV